MSCKECVHESLKGSGGSAKAERHPIKYIETAMSDECGLFAVGRVNCNLHVTAKQVNRGKEFLSVQVNENIINAGKGIRVLHSVGIEAAIVYAEPKGVFRGIDLFLTYYYYGGGIGTVARVRFRNDSRAFERVELVIYKGSARPR